jgi:hypothetical protein
VLAREQQRDQESRDLGVREGTAVGVARRHQRVEEVFATTVVASALRHDAGDQLDHAATRPVAAAERGERQVRVEERHQIDRAFEIVVQVRELFRQPLPELRADEAPGRDEDGQLV